MKLKNKKLWEGWVKKNTEPYGRCCVEVAKEAMKLLDKDNTPLHSGYYPDIHTPHGLICQADENIKAGGITGFMADCVENIIIGCHERGDEFGEASKKTREE